MAAFLYHLPGREGNARERLEGLGFAHAFAYGNPTVISQRGPGGDGMLVVPPAPVTPAPCYLPDQQTWSEWFDGRVWIGWENANPPKPADIVRPDSVSGYAVSLHDSNEWIVPVARLFPGTVGCNKDGTGFVKDVLPAYVDLSRRAEACLSRLGTERIVNIPNEEAFDLACAALAVNYMLGKCEATALRLLTDAQMDEVIGALIDLPTILRVTEELAKNAGGPETPSTSATSSGDGASSANDTPDSPGSSGSD